MLVDQPCLTVKYGLLKLARSRQPDSAVCSDASLRESVLEKPFLNCVACVGNFDDDGPNYQGQIIDPAPLDGGNTRRLLVTVDLCSRKEVSAEMYSAPLNTR